jgi:hypothetical protein
MRVIKSLISFLFSQNYIDFTKGIIHW